MGRRTISWTEGEDGFLSLCRFREFLVFEIFGVEQLYQRVTEQVRVIPIVETPLKLVEVVVKMLCTDLVKRANDGTLEQAPYAFHAVRVNIASHLAFNTSHLGDAIALICGLP